MNIKINDLIIRAFAICAVAISHSFANAQMNADSIITNQLKIAGIKNVKTEMKNYSIEGEILQNNMSFPIRIKGVLPNKFRMDMTFNKKDFVKITNGKTKWEYNPLTDSVSKGTAPENEALEFAERWFGALFWHGEKNTSAKLLGTITVDDIEVYKLEFKWNGQFRIYYIDKYTYLIVRIDDDYVENKITYYSDYRKNGKYYLPYSITGYENGIPMMSMKFNDVKINNEIPETFFPNLNKQF